MSLKSVLILLPFGAAILASCGASKEAAKKLDAANAQISSLQTENAQLQTTVNDQKKQMSDLSSQNGNLNTQFASYKKQCQANEEQLKQVNAVLEEFHQNVATLIEKLQTAEAKFQDKGLEVYSKDGIVFVDMKDNLLYKSGSAALSPQGKEALSNLASVLNEFPKLKVIVVGNTDTMHVKGVKDNWSLSTERANGVVRVLSKDYNVDPVRLTAAGKSKFNPIADNSTAEGRAKNRRTEIVLNPDWERIWETVKMEKAGQ
jgi:chemotaxis protein MotB